METNSYHDYLTCLNDVKFDVSAVLTLDLFATYALYGVKGCITSLISSDVLLPYQVCFHYLSHSWDHFIDWTTMHQSAHTGSRVRFLPAMYSFSGPTSLPQFDFGTPRTSDDLQKLTHYNRYVAIILGL